MIPYGRQEITEADIDEVNKVLRSDFLTQGPTVPRFEQSVANYCGVSNAIAVNSATSALHIACLALDLSPGDWLWTSPNTFVASANCGRYCGADIDFVDTVDGDVYISYSWGNQEGTEFLGSAVVKGMTSEEWCVSLFD